MTAFIAGTWQLIYSSAEVITGARRMTVRIHRLLQPGALQLDERDRRRLLGLQKRVECLVQPLNFLHLWSKKRDSCVQQIVLSAQELLFDVCGFVERFTPQENLPSSVEQRDGGVLDSEQLEYYLRELEFACASVSMAVSIAKAHDTAPPGSSGSGAGMVPATSSTAGAEPSGGVSLSALLRASRRIQEMNGRSGDLCACPGRLFSLLSSSPSDEVTAHRGGVPNGTSAKKEWAPAMSLATFKVVAALDPRQGRRRYSIAVESRLPLSQKRENNSLLSDALGESMQSNGGGLNSSGPLNFPIEAALDACLVTTGQMSLPASESDRRALDLGIDALALIWGGASSGSSAAVVSEELVEMSSEFPDAVLLPESSTDGIPRSLRPALRHLRSASPSPRVSPTPASPRVVKKYAFVFDRPRGQAEARACEAEIALSPLDAMYLARLCALDDGHHHQPLPQEDGTDATASCPPHLLTADEVLVALLQEGNYVDSVGETSVQASALLGACDNGSNGHVGRDGLSTGAHRMSAPCGHADDTRCAEGPSHLGAATTLAGHNQVRDVAAVGSSCASEETWTLGVQEGTLQGLN